MSQGSFPGAQLITGDQSKTKQADGAKRQESKKKKENELKRERANCCVPEVGLCAPTDPISPGKGQVLGKPISPLRRK